MASDVSCSISDLTPPRVSMSINQARMWMLRNSSPPVVTGQRDPWDFFAGLVKIINFLSPDFEKIFQKKCSIARAAITRRFEGEKSFVTFASSLGPSFDSCTALLWKNSSNRERRRRVVLWKGNTKRINEQHWNLRFFKLATRMSLPEPCCTRSQPTSLPAGPMLTSFTNYPHRHFRFKSNFEISTNFTCRDARECLWSSPNIWSQFDNELRRAWIDQALSTVLHWTPQKTQSLRRKGFIDFFSFENFFSRFALFRNGGAEKRAWKLMETNSHSRDTRQECFESLK